MNHAIAAYVAQADGLHTLVQGLTHADLVAPPPRDDPSAGDWTIQQVIIHLWHSDLAATHRMLRIACEDRPLLIAYDESAHALELGYNDLDVPVVCDLFRLNRLHTADILGRLPEAAFSRVGIHNQRGVVTLAQILETYARHVEHHGAFIHRKRAALGKA